MAAIIYITVQRDMLDAILYRHYGRTSEVVERVLEANPGLASQGPLLPPGLSIVIPDIPSTGDAPIIPTTRLWD